ncbi:DUF4280 domain-containing protein [[Clostridium] colinum]|uniref:DUF4280 domain-containing protein n=1 Tax=[Clostridium] colinum TaxID=36835 RepID=UPI00202439C3|nr:DUF4280 domain-containing protein [[Clostridium] colinum]
MAKNVRDGATLSCTLGTGKSKLKVSRDKNALINGEPQAVISDNVLGVNITNFCSCKKTNPPTPCIPMILLKWQLADKNHKIQGEVALLDNCILPCLNGGIIKIEKSGQTKE